MSAKLINEHMICPICGEGHIFVDATAFVVYRVEHWEKEGKIDLTLGECTDTMSEGVHSVYCSNSKCHASWKDLHELEEEIKNGRHST